METLYQAPLCEVIEIEIEGILCYSPAGDGGSGSSDQLSDLLEDTL